MYLTANTAGIRAGNEHNGFLVNTALNYGRAGVELYWNVVYFPRAFNHLGA